MLVLHEKTSQQTRARPPAQRLEDRSQKHNALADKFACDEALRQLKESQNMDETLRVMVPAREHANLDSLPLRFGLHFLEDTQIELFNLTDLGVDDRFNDRHHYEGYIRNPMKQSEEVQFGHFVIGYRQRANHWALVTAWRNSSQDDEYFLSNTLRNLREDGILSPTKLLRMHPHYLNKEINSSASLLTFLSRSLAQEEIVKARKSEERARVDTEKALEEIKIAREEASRAMLEADRARSIALEAIETVESLEVRAINAEQAEQEARSLLAAALAQIQQNEVEQGFAAGKGASTVNPPARSVTAVWKSKTGSDYRNVGLEASVVNVQKLGNQISLTFVGQNGVEKTVQDFGRQGFVSSVFDYLNSRKGKQAVFLVTQKPGKDVHLASDTMMPAYKGLWA